MDNIEDEKSSFTCCSSSSTTKMGDNNEDEVPHVLAVDDNDVDRKLIERLLNRSSCKVTTTESAMSALEYLGIGDDQQNTSEASKYDLILTDYCMPGLTGYDLLKKIKESPEHKEIPVVIMSSENEPARISKCLEEGAEMFMLKPLKLSDARTIRSQAVKSKH